MKDTNRRTFLKHTATMAAVTPLAVHAAGGDMIRVGLIGCGGRGTGAAAQALKADKNVKLTAMADAFADKIDRSFETLSKQAEVKDKLDVPKERRFTGFDAYKQVTDNVDVVLLTTPPHFRPLHIEYAVEQGKHIFAEKPVAVDSAGVRSVLAACEKAKTKKVSVVSGLCLRYYNCFEETMRKIHNGDIGDVVCLQANDYRGGAWDRTRAKLTETLGREPTEMEYQMRNWYHFTWLSGDFNVEQHVHFLDVCAWALKDRYPNKCIAMGARQTRPDNGGNIYDSFSAVFDYDNGVKVYSNTRHIRGQKVYRNMGAEVKGTKGSGVISEYKNRHHLRTGNTADQLWRFKGKHNHFYQAEHDRLFASIRAGKPINNGDYMAKSTLMAIMERESAYTGQAITWEQVLNSKQNLSPNQYDWNAAPPVSPLAVPGETPFV
jgi:predicted dehydrogenase